MKILRKPAVLEMVGYSGMHIDRLEKAGRFPKRVRLGENAVGWVEEEIDAWISAKVEARDNGSDAALITRPDRWKAARDGRWGK